MTEAHTIMHNLEKKIILYNYFLFSIFSATKMSKVYLIIKTIVKILCSVITFIPCAWLKRPLDDLAHSAGILAMKYRTCVSGLNVVSTETRV